MMEDAASIRRPLRTVAWLTHGRPETLARSVKSFVDGSGPAAASYRYIISESGRGAGMHPMDIPSSRVLRIDELYRERWIARLEESLSDLGYRPGIAKFALSCAHPEGSEGSHRNAITLLSQGEPCLCADDDVIFDIKSLPDSATTDSTPTAYPFHPFRDSAQLDEFERDAESIPVQEFMRLHETALQVATFSSPGLRGDSAYGGARFIFTFPDSALEAHCRRANFVATALSSRIMWRQAARNHLVPYAAIATYLFGMDGRLNLAPCFPFHRNVDGAFIYATKALNPEARTAHLQTSVLHRPPVDRGRYPSLETLEFRINDLLWLIWSEWLRDVPAAMSSADRHELASRHFREIGSRPLEAFGEFLGGLAVRSLLERAAQLEAQVHRLREKSGIAGLPAWTELAAKEVALCRKIALDANTGSEWAKALPLESHGPDRRDDERLRITREWILSYGWLLAAWPVMRKTTRDEFLKDF